MTGETKIHLSSFELDLVSDPHWILTKNAVMEKAKALLGALANRMSDHTKEMQYLPGELFHIPPKISKGENYRGLPYLILDYPRVFEKENVFAIRTFFWWGHFFSCTLQLSGIYKDRYEDMIAQQLARSQQADLYYGNGDDPWEHHFDTPNYIPLTSADKNALLALFHQRDFLKLSAHMPLSEWELAPEKLFGYFRNFLEWLKD